MAASSVGLLVGASIGAACLGNYIAREGAQRQDAARLMMASRDGVADMASLDASGDGKVDHSALNIAMRFSQYAGTGTENTLLSQTLTAMRISDDAREQRGLPDAKIVLASNMTPVAPLMGDSPVNTVVRAAAAMNFKAASRSDADCLTQAVYYEARGEGADGMRAVAQVILNRVRHPAYPKSICGVVYQGASKRVSCQFSFVCNGAMGAPVEGWAWRRAKQVADAALGGYVMSAVGTSTSFHSISVRPGWSGTMDRVATIGTHVFYQSRGRGSRIANTADGVQPSEGVPQVPADNAPPVIETQTTGDQVTAALNNSQVKPATARPIQVVAHVRGKSAQEIVAEVALPAARPAAAPAIAPATIKGVSQ